ncbi:hypothetical protein KXX33_008295 [Aspergillus fumigatus]|uniref:Uncharacterized protein n=1 Tax=Aspergillus fumigatus TaxID=746128 RepID=A0A9P8SMY8_ASPFM|nr:hypothetical protein CNMCM8714_007185 [Aspergillus fumigatus]KAH1291738.1 hypothetical protein KXX11_009968 [Aspergillus fumigatus]KAH1354030.1 hypothetical protein KXX33_008295 [Aspergillus fumigatus]KAH1438803.1 hypothetical protein KXX68_006034 [Aspergillus fumigatus]KAH1456177.1 hypothetical protein KXX53_006360 [Aspergillus fumigatus]
MGNLFKKLMAVGKLAEAKPFGRKTKPIFFATDYDGIVTKDDGKEYHKYQLQPNAGKIPSTIKEWRDNNGGTHAVIATMYIEKGSEPDDNAFEAAVKSSLEGL